MYQRTPLSVLRHKSRQFWRKRFRWSGYDYKALLQRNWSPFVNRLKRHQVRTVLDLGCGYGHWSIVMARAGFQVTAVDISPAAIAALKKWAREEKVSIVTRLCALQDFRSKCRYNAVICNSVLDHLPHEDTMKVMAKIRTLLKSAGIVYISFDGLEKEEKKEYRLLSDGTRIFIKGRYKNMVWRYYTDDEIKGLLNGYKILQYRVHKNGERSIWLKKDRLLSFGCK